MGRRSWILFILALLASPALADPEIPGTADPADKQMLTTFGNSFLSIAKTFGCDNFRWANFAAGKRSMALEYVPTGDDINQWTRMMTITVFPLPEGADAQHDALSKLEGALLGAYSKGKIFNEANYSDQKGDPRLFVEYEIGEGLQKEHNAGTFLRTAPNLAAFVQIQSRGKEFDPKDAADMKALAENHLHLTGN
jgi:hypothetical protein